MEGPRASSSPTVPAGTAWPSSSTMAISISGNGRRLPREPYLCGAAGSQRGDVGEAQPGHPYQSTTTTPVRGALAAGAVPRGRRGLQRGSRGLVPASASVPVDRDDSGAGDELALDLDGDG